MLKGTLIAQIISFFGSLIIAKLYGSEAFGLFGYFIGYASIFSVLFLLEIDKKIITLTDKFEIKNTFNSLLLLILFSTLILLLLIYTIHFLISTQLNYKILLFAVIGGSFMAFLKLFEAIFTQKNLFKPKALGKVIYVVFVLIFQLLLYLNLKTLGLIIGYILSLITVFFYYLKIFDKIKIRNIFKSNLKKVLENSKQFTRYLFPSTLINTISLQILPILIVYFFSLKITGIYFLSVKILNAPLNLIVLSVSHVYFKKSSRMLDLLPHKLFGFTLNIIKYNVLIMGILLLLINTLGIYLLELFFTKNWEHLRIYLLIISFFTLFRSAFNPISNIIIVLNKNIISLYFNIYLFLVNLIAIYIGFTNNNFILTLIILSIFGSLGYLYLLLYFMNKLKKLK